MSRARSNSQPTAAAFESQGSGCFSGYVLPPLAVIFVGTLLALFAFNATPADLTVQAAAPSAHRSEPATGYGCAGSYCPALPRAPPSSLFASGSAAQAPEAGNSTIVPESIRTSNGAAGFRSTIAGVHGQVQYWSTSLSRWAAAAGLDPNMAAVVMQIESCGDPSATSRSGAIGLFQVMPYHFSASDEPYDPDTNAATRARLSEAVAGRGKERRPAGLCRLQRRNWRDLAQ